MIQTLVLDKFKSSPKVVNSGGAVCQFGGSAVVGVKSCFVDSGELFRFADPTTGAEQLGTGRASFRTHPRVGLAPTLPTLAAGPLPAVRTTSPTKVKASFPGVLRLAQPPSFALRGPH